MKLRRHILPLLAAVLYAAVACSEGPIAPPLGGRFLLTPEFSVGGGGNEPGDFTSFTDRPWSTFGEDSWSDASDSDYTVVEDTTAPASPDSVGQISFPLGFRAGYSPAYAERYIGDLNLRSVYLSYWVKLSNNWQGHQGGDNKILYFKLPEVNVIALYDVSGSDPVHTQLQVRNGGNVGYSANVNDVVVSRGEWVHWEVLLVANTPGVADGEMHWWIDGTAAGAYTGVQLADSSQSSTWNYIKWDPVWGGGNDSVTVSGMNMRMDNMYGSGSTGVPVANSNEPSGFTQLTDRAWDTLRYTFTAGQWRDANDTDYTLVVESSAPMSPTGVGQMSYPLGFQGGYAPAWADLGIESAGDSSVYVSFWFKLSSNWQGHKSGVNKVGYAWIHDNPAVYFNAYGADSAALVPRLGLQGTLGGALNLVPNVDTTITLTRGAWHHWEALLVANTGSNYDGEAHWWVDGTKVGEYSNVGYGSATQAKVWQTLTFRPIWGGGADTVSVSGMNIRMDHYYASGR